MPSGKERREALDERTKYNRIKIVGEKTGRGWDVHASGRVRGRSGSERSGRQDKEGKWLGAGRVPEMGLEPQHSWLIQVLSEGLSPEQYQE